MSSWQTERRKGQQTQVDLWASWWDHEAFFFLLTFTFLWSQLLAWRSWTGQKPSAMDPNQLGIETEVLGGAEQSKGMQGSQGWINRNSWEGRGGRIPPGQGGKVRRRICAWAFRALCFDRIWCAGPALQTVAMEMGLDLVVLHSGEEDRRGGGGWAVVSGLAGNASRWGAMERDWQATDQGLAAWL